jgi:hypothetical protein
MPPQIVAGDEDDDRIGHRLGPAVSRPIRAARGRGGFAGSRRNIAIL